MDFSRADVAHLLRRAGFGGSASEIDALTALPSWAAVVDQVLDTSANPPDLIPPEVDDRKEPSYGPWVAATHHWMDRMATTPTPIVEKMTLFWHGHLTSSTVRAWPREVFRQVQTYRRLALGDLHELAQAAALEPAMLQWLDNDSNTVEGPNENFARELMQLFLLGLGNYDETDVREMARAWTGHGYDSGPGTYLWRPALHDGGQKTIFGITRNWDGPETITEMVRGSKQAACARHIAARLWTFLAGPTPTPQTVDTLATAFSASGMHIKELVRAVFLHPEFRSPSTRAGLVRSPAEWMAAAMKVLGLTSASVQTHQFLPRCGQKLYAPITVAGWDGNDGWVTTAMAWERGNFASLVRWVARDSGVFSGYGTLAPTQAVDLALARFALDDLSPVTRAALEGFVSGEQASGRRSNVPPGLVALIMLSPDFQMA